MNRGKGRKKENFLGKSILVRVTFYGSYRDCVCLLWRLFPESVVYLSG